MRIRRAGQFLGGTTALLVLVAAAQSPAAPAAEFASLVKAFLSLEPGTDWDGLDRLPPIKWAAPTRMLENCLPDGGCFTRQGTALLGGRNLTVVSTGARTIVRYLYLRNGSAAIGEAAVLGAIKEAGFTAELARCPVQGGRGGTNWYRLTAAGLTTGVLSIQTNCNGRPCEGFVLSQGDELMPLQPNQVSLYSEQCAAGADRKAVSALLPHQRLAEVIVALIPAASGPPSHDWTGLTGLPTGIEWTPGGPKRAALTFKNDPNPMMVSGQATYASRKFSVIASGTAAQVQGIHFDEGGMHPRGEHLLGVVYEKGFQVQLVRCGPIYTESTHNWYRVSSARTRPVMVLQSIRYEGNLVQDTYWLRLDGTLPARDPRDRDPGVNGCR